MMTALQQWKWPLWLLGGVLMIITTGCPPVHRKRAFRPGTFRHVGKDELGITPPTLEFTGKGRVMFTLLLVEQVGRYEIDPPNIFINTNTNLGELRLKMHGPDTLESSLGGVYVRE